MAHEDTAGLSAMIDRLAREAAERQGSLLEEQAAVLLRAGYEISDLQVIHFQGGECPSVVVPKRIMESVKDESRATLTGMIESLGEGDE